MTDIIDVIDSLDDMCRHCGAFPVTGGWCEGHYWGMPE